MIRLTLKHQLQALPDAVQAAQDEARVSVLKRDEIVEHRKNTLLRWLKANGPATVTECIAAIPMSAKGVVVYLQRLLSEQKVSRISTGRGKPHLWRANERNL
jgi:predicted ArsR family transcriptional regulator